MEEMPALPLIISDIIARIYGSAGKLPDPFAQIC
jgi:hypothetical protein